MSKYLIRVSFKPEGFREVLTKLKATGDRAAVEKLIGAGGWHRGAADAARTRRRGDRMIGTIRRLQADEQACRLKAWLNPSVELGDGAFLCASTGEIEMSAQIEAVQTTKEGFAFNIKDDAGERWMTIV